MISAAASSSLRNRLVDTASKAAVTLIGLPLPSANPRLSPEDRDTFMSLLEPGDIVLESSDNYPGWQVTERILFGADYTHSAMYAGNGRIIDVDTSSCVRERKMDDFLESHRFAILRPRYGTPEDRDAALGYCRSVLGRPYDAEFDLEHDDKLYCSELMYNALRRMPHPIQVPTQRALGRDMVGPDDFRKSGSIDMIWNNGGSLARSLCGTWPVAFGTAAGAAIGAHVGGIAGAVVGGVLGTVGTIVGGDLSDRRLRHDIREWVEGLLPRRGGKAS